MEWPTRHACTLPLVRRPTGNNNRPSHSTFDLFDDPNRRVRALEPRDSRRDTFRGDRFRQTVTHRGVARPAGRRNENKVLGRSRRVVFGPQTIADIRIHGAYTADSQRIHKRIEYE